MKKIKSKTLTAKRKGKKQKAFKDDVKKIANLAFGLIDKKKSIKKDIKNGCQNTEQKQVQDQKNSKQSEVQIQFFYTNDKYFTQYDDKSICAAIQTKYPTFIKDGISDGDLKKVIIHIIQDTEFLNALLQDFNINIQEFFKFLFRREWSIFKGPYLRKLQRILKENKYDI